MHALFQHSDGFRNVWEKLIHWTEQTLIEGLVSVVTIDSDVNNHYWVYQILLEYVY